MVSLDVESDGVLWWYRKTPGRRRLSLWKESGPLCAYCQRETTQPKAGDQHPLMATIDHKTPLSRRGRDNRNNVVLACRDCNELKGGLTAEEFEAAILWGVDRCLELTPRCKGDHVQRLTSMSAWRPFFEVLEQLWAAEAPHPLI